MSRILQIVDAERAQVSIKMGLKGPSGSGKTASALLLAHGIEKDWSKIGVIDTENKSASLYVGSEFGNVRIGKFKALNLSAPYEPEVFIEAIKLFEKAGVTVLITDSLTHAWSGEGGVLDIHNKLGGRFETWAKVAPRHQRLVDTIRHANMHCICCLRSKSDYVMEQGQNGKTTPKKVGLKADQKDTLEYELTLVLDINMEHLATAEKDRTNLFMGRTPFVVTPSAGEELLTWAQTGELAPAPVACFDFTNREHAAIVTGLLARAGVTDEWKKAHGRNLANQLQGLEMETVEAAVVSFIARTSNNVAE